MEGQLKEKVKHLILPESEGGGRVPLAPSSDGSAKCRGKIRGRCMCVHGKAGSGYYIHTTALACHRNCKYLSIGEQLTEMFVCLRGNAK